MKRNNILLENKYELNSLKSIIDMKHPTTSAGINAKMIICVFSPGLKGDVISILLLPKLLFFISDISKDIYVTYAIALLLVRLIPCPMRKVDMASQTIIHEEKD